MTTTVEPEAPEAPEPRPRDLSVRELARWIWRQLTSMRTALLLLLLTALAAVPGSLIPQEGVDSLKTSRWQDQHPTLTPIYDRLGLFDVYSSAWFSAIYLLLMISLVGCIVPRLGVYWRALRAAPPSAPRRLDRLPAHASYTSEQSVEEVLDRARGVLRGRRYRLADGDGAVSAEKGHLREAGNLVFHLALLVVLAGFGLGSLYGYKGGAIIVVGDGFSNTLTSYDDLAPGRLFDPDVMEPFTFTVDDFSAQWLYTGPRAGMAQKFEAPLTYRTEPGAQEEHYDLRVNHPLSIGGTDIFLIGHGYAPVITVTDGDGNVAASGPRPFLPTDGRTFRSFGVVKAANASPTQIGLQGELYPTYAFDHDHGPYSTFGEALDPFISMTVWTGDLGLSNGTPQSVYALDTAQMTMLKKDDGAPFRVDLRPGESVELPDGLGKVSFDGLQPWVRVQISRQPGIHLALGGVIAALLGLLGSLFIRPRRLWVRARTGEGGTLVEVGGLDRTEGGDPADEVAAIVAALRGEPAPDRPGDPQREEPEA
ncbi:cytochrome c biogenesis protein ResB [Nocardioides sp.]|uniref:cytochrome c biogenesis protein ResB n=1 Tax=Nocardioides sp. TaxID=35761 RepID=UPI0035299D19